MPVTLETHVPLQVNSRKIRILMIERGLRPGHLAAKWGVTPQAVSQVVNGRRPTSLLLGKLAKALGVRLEEILVDGTNGKEEAA